MMVTGKTQGLWNKYFNALNVVFCPYVDNPFIQFFLAPTEKS
jgi:hypothetical protein